MATPRFGTVDDYLAAQPALARRILRRVRAVIRAAVPAVTEAIRYDMPAFQLDGTTVLYLAGWKSHYSLYPATQPLVAAFAADLAPYDVNDKGTIRFAFDATTPVHLIGRLAKFRAAEVRAAAKQKPKAKTRTKAKRRSKTTTKARTKPKGKANARKPKGKANARHGPPRATAVRKRRRST